MKYLKRFLLSLLWILIPSTIVVLLSYQGITLGAFFTIVLHAPFLYLLSLTWRGNFDCKKLPPAIPADKTTDGPISDESTPASPIKPKKPLFERYDTYITCPGCGSLVHKGTKQCECGYDLSGPTVRLCHLFRRSAPVLLCIILFIAGGALGYYAGQERMKPHLEEQYSTGYDYGYSNGLHDGLSDGRDAGYSEASQNYAKVFEDGYRTGIANYLTNSYGGNSPYLEFYKFDFANRDNLLHELGKSFGFNDATPPIMPRLTSGKSVPVK